MPRQACCIHVTDACAWTEAIYSRYAGQDSQHGHCAGAYHESNTTTEDVMCAKLAHGGPQRAKLRHTISDSHQSEADIYHEIKDTASKSINERGGAKQTCFEQCQDTENCGGATAGFVMVDGTGVTLDEGLDAAIRRAACAASARAFMCTEAHACTIQVRTRFLAVSGTQTASLCLDDYAPLPDTCARMIVQVPSTYRADATVKATARLGDSGAQTYILNAKSDQEIPYVFAKAQCSVCVQGRGAWLVCDVVSSTLTQACTCASADNSRVVQAIQACVQQWQSKSSGCQKLAVALHERCEDISARGGLTLANLRNERDRAIVQALMRCEDLDVAIAGMCSWILTLFFPCVFITYQTLLGLFCAFLLVLVTYVALLDLYTYNT